MALMPASEIQLTLLPSLVNLWQGKNWRVRLGVVQSVPCLFSKLVSHPSRPSSSCFLCLKQSFAFVLLHLACVAASKR
ncbi:unnamed protein product [Dibothriocephalus latus]|uniref:Uncharacterized protein n=1 Tax=Dibothriocephalus latus TaxID=60516 RepID=A0A3P7MP25_DIBLA|nr:unnamed protein product [Dibothriocephalus latus]